MTSWIPPRLRSLLGDSLEAITEERLASLCGLPEDYDLDYKRQRYQTGGKGPIAAALDIAAFANASGGLLIIGIEEDGSGVASRVVPDTPEGDFGLWIDQVVAARISPAPTTRYRCIPVTDGSVHVVCVPPSPRKPHAVSVSNETLKYPVRSGTTTRYMYEPEIADQYAQRVKSRLDLESRVSAIHKAATKILTESNKLHDQCWHILSGTPSVPGNLTLQAGIEEQWMDWVGPALQSLPTASRHLPTFADRHVRSASVGFRSIELTDGLGGNSEFSFLSASLRLDGSGVIAFGHAGNRHIHQDSSEVCDVYDEHVVSDVIHGLCVLSNHAIRTGATGDLTVGSQLFSDRLMALFQYRGTFRGQLSGTRTVDRITPVAMRSTPVELPSVPSPDLLALARLILSDTFSTFGLPQPYQITSENQLNLRHFYRFQAGPSDARKDLAEWAAEAGIESIDVVA